MKKRILLGGVRGPVAGLMRPLVTVEVRTRTGDFVPIRFSVDTGADSPALPIPLAIAQGIPFPQLEGSSSRVGGLIGTARQVRDFIRVRMFGEEFSWPCGFIEAGAPGRIIEYGVLGRLGFALAFHGCLKYPYCQIERRTDQFPLWRRCLAFFARWQTVDYDVPL